MTPARRTRWRWTRLQYSLSTLLILTAVVAGVCAWWVRPKTITWSAPGGMTVQVQVQGRQELVEDQWPYSEIVAQGSWMLRDRDGGRRVAGNLAADGPHGWWAVYYENGRSAVEGRCQHGWKVGAWQSWWPDGTRRAEWQYAPPEPSDADQPARDTGSSVLSGPVRVWWPNGQLRCAGQYRQNQEEGNWTFWDESGREVASGPFRDGVRHGRWTFAEDSDAGARTVIFSRGAPVDEAAFPGLAETLQRGTPAEKLAAADALQRSGAAAVEFLAQSLTSTDTTTRLLAVRALARIGAEADGAAAAVKALVDDADPHIRRYARLALFLADPAHRDQRYATVIEALAEADPRDEFDALVRIFRESPPHRRSVFPRLLELVSRKQPPRFAELVERLRDRLPALPARLAESLANEQVAVRAATVEMLAAIRSLDTTQDPTAFGLNMDELLKRVADDPDPDIRARVGQLLGSGGGGMGGGMF